MSAKKNRSFSYILHNVKVHPDQKLKCLENLSIFEKVLMTPGMGSFIELCLRNGSEFFKVSKIQI